MTPEINNFWVFKHKNDTILKFVFLYIKILKNYKTTNIFEKIHKNLNIFQIINEIKTFSKKMARLHQISMNESEKHVTYKVKTFFHTGSSVFRTVWVWTLRKVGSFYVLKYFGCEHNPFSKLRANIFLQWKYCTFEHILKFY